MGQYDLSGKQTVHLYALAWAEWLLRRSQLKVEIEAELSEGLQFIVRESDILLQVKGKAGRFLVLTELQTYYDPNMARRLAAYAALAREKYQHPVYVTVVYLLPPPSNAAPAKAFHEEFMGQMAHQDYEVIPVWELEAKEALALDNPALVPFVPLMRGGATVETLTLCTERIHREPEAAELEVLLSTFASLVMDINLVRQIVRWDMKILLESPVYQELLKEGYLRGLNEGREAALNEGREEGREAALDFLRRFLAYRFGLPRDHFDRRLRPLGLETLKQLGDIAFEAENFAAFTEALAQAEEIETGDRDRE
jgi:predicted transposase YdaD